jgi:hypothetical protein
MYSGMIDADTIQIEREKAVVNFASLNPHACSMAPIPRFCSKCGPFRSVGPPGSWGNKMTAADLWKSTRHDYS